MFSESSLVFFPLLFHLILLLGFNPAGRITVCQVRFCKTTDKVNLDVFLCCNFEFVRLDFQLMFKFRLVRARKASRSTYNACFDRHAYRWRWSDIRLLKI